jgi:hypothetical protein
LQRDPQSALTGSGIELSDQDREALQGVDWQEQSEKLRERINRFRAAL